MKRLPYLLLPIGLALALLMMLRVPVKAAPGSSLCTPLPYGYGLMPWTITTNGWASHPWFSNVTTNTEKNVISGDLSAGANGHADIILSDWLSGTLYPGAKGYLIVVQITADADADRFNVAADQIPSSDFDFDLSNTGAYSVAAGRLNASTVLSTYVSLWDESNHSVHENPNQANEFDFTWYWVGPGNIDVTFSAQFWVIVDSPQACPGPAQMPFGPSCTITTTQTIRTGPLVTETAEVTVTYPVSTNMVTNYSFEEGTLTPSAWSPVRNGSQLASLPPFWDYNVNTARSYYRSVYDGDVFELDQRLQLHSSGDFLVGFYGRCVSADCSADSVSLYWGDHLITTTSGLTDTYSIYSDTYSVGYGSAWLRLRFDTGSQNIHIDDVFAYPIDGSGNLECTSAFYPPPVIDPGTLDECLIDPLTGGCMVIPTGTGGNTCHYCGRPSSADALMISYWIAWLGCVIRNLFVCNLKIWLLVVGNWINGNVKILLAFLVWTPDMIQGGADWLAGTIVPSLIQAIQGISTGAATNVWDVILALIALLRDLVSSISSLMLGMVNLITSVIDAIRTGFAASAYEFHFGDAGITEPNSGDLAAAGVNDSKMLYLAMLGLGLIDTFTSGNQYISAMLLVVIGGVGITVLIWTLRYWRRFVTF